jgi:hypothetical protein
LIGVSQHYLGNQESARRHLERVLVNDVISVGKQVIRFQIDPQVAARALLARILWLQGFPDQAMRIAERSMASGDANSLPRLRSIRAGDEGTPACLCRSRSIFGSGGGRSPSECAGCRRVSSVSRVAARLTPHPTCAAALLIYGYLVDHYSAGTCDGGNGVNNAGDFCCRSRHPEKDRRIIGEISYITVFAKGAQKLLMVERLDLGGEGTVGSLPDLRADAFQGLLKAEREPGRCAIDEEQISDCEIGLSIPWAALL